MLFKAIVLGAVLYYKRRCFWLHGDVIGDKADGLPYMAARQFLLLGHMPCFSSEFLNREMSAEKQKNHLLCRWWEKLKLQV